MDGCIDSDREVSSTKKKSLSDIDNVPMFMSEEEEAQMESMMRRMLPQSREKCPACLLPSLRNEKDSDDEEDNDDDDDDNDDKEDDNDDDNNDDNMTVMRKTSVTLTSTTSRACPGTRQNSRAWVCLGA